MHGGIASSIRRPNGRGPAGRHGQQMLISMLISMLI
jgi:hypothetical protein